MQRASVLQLKIARKLCYSFSVALTLVLLSFCLMACSVASGCGASDLSSTCQPAVHPTVDYTLKKGCWITGTMHVSQRNSLTWDVGVELTRISCVDTTPIAHYNWHFQVQKQYGLFVITSIGLYPTGSQNK